MSKRSRMSILVVLLLALAPAHAFDCFVLLDNIPGESKDPWHTNWIAATFVGSQVTRPGLRPEVQLNLAKPADKSSPLLALRCADGRPIDRAAIEFIRDTGRRMRFYRISLTNVYISTFQQSAAAASQDRPTETLALNFESISWTYTEMNKEGMPLRNLGAYWDLSTVRGGSSTEPLVRLAASKEGADMAVSWLARAGVTYQVLGSSQVIGPYNFLQNLTSTSNATVRTTFPIASGNLFFQVATTPESP